MGKQAVRIPLVEPHEPPVQSSKLFSRDLLQFGIHGIAADDLKVLAVQIAFPHELQTQPNQFVVVVPCDAGSNISPKPGCTLPSPGCQIHGGERLLEVVRYATNRIVSVGQSIQREIQVNHELRAALQEVIDCAFQLLRQQAVRGEVQRTHVVVVVKNLDDFSKVLAQEWFATRNP